MTDDLRKEEFRYNSNKLVGHCYVASEALFHLTGKRLKPMYIRHCGKSHWFLKDKNGRVIDITAAQFKRPIPYDKAKGKGFLTKKPSKRTRILIKRISNEK